MATRRWLGRAVDVAQVDTVTIALTWATNDTITITCNNKTLVVTIGANITTNQVATTLQQAFENVTLSDTTASVTPANGKEDFPELAELDAIVSGSVVTFTGNTKGKPVTYTVSESTTGDGTATKASVTVATGKNHFDNQDNWSGNAVPVDATDDIVFDVGDTDLLYAINTAVKPGNVYIYRSYTGKIGLHAQNQDSNDPNRWYDEYRERFLTFGGITGTITDLQIGDGEGAGSSRIFIDWAAHAVTNLYVRGTAAREREDEPAVQLSSTTGVVVAIHALSGDVGIGVREGETVLASAINIGERDGDPVTNVVCGPGFVTTSGDVTITQNRGTFTYNSDDTTNDLDITIRGGVADILEGSLNDVTIEGGIFYWSTKVNQQVGGVNTLTGDGQLNFDRDTIAKNVNTIEKYSEDSELFDRFGVIVAPVIDMNHCRDLSRLHINSNRRITIGATS